MSPSALAIALEAVRGELVEAQQWHAAAELNTSKADALMTAAVAGERDAAERVAALQSAIAELEQLQRADDFDIDEVPEGAEARGGGIFVSAEMPADWREVEA